MMKPFKDFILPDYPMQLPPEEDDGCWLTGDPPKGIEFPLSGKVRGIDDTTSILKTASNTISKEREAMKRKKND